MVLHFFAMSYKWLGILKCGHLHLRPTPIKYIPKIVYDVDVLNYVYWLP